jgi:hypothetical protein
MDRFHSNLLSQIEYALQSLGQVAMVCVSDEPAFYTKLIQETKSLNGPVEESAKAPHPTMDFRICIVDGDAALVESGTTQSSDKIPAEQVAIGGDTGYQANIVGMSNEVDYVIP